MVGVLAVVAVAGIFVGVKYVTGYKSSPKYILGIIGENFSKGSDKNSALIEEYFGTEREGFEPTVRFPAHLFSRQAP